MNLRHHLTCRFAAGKKNGCSLYIIDRQQASLLLFFAQFRYPGVCLALWSLWLRGKEAIWTERGSNFKPRAQRRTLYPTNLGRHRVIEAIFRICFGQKQKFVSYGQNPFYSSDSIKFFILEARFIMQGNFPKFLLHSAGLKILHFEKTQ